MTDEDFVKRLERDIEVWRRDNVITADQQTAILARYGLAEVERRRNHIAIMLAFLGASLIGIGVIVFFAANWQYIPGSVKIALIYAAVIAAYLSGYLLRYEKQIYRGTGNALLFLGAILYGAAIFLIAQGFHVNANEPSLLLLWAVGVLPMAYLLRSPAILVLALLSLGLAVMGDVYSWLYFSATHASVTAVLIFGILLYSLGNLHNRRESTQLYKLPYGVLGLIVTLAALFPHTFGEYCRGIRYVSAGSIPHGLALHVAVLLAAAVVVTLWNVWAQHHRSRILMAETASLLVLLCVGGTLFFIGATGQWLGIFFNILFFALTIGTMVVGYCNKEPAWVNVGIVFFAVHVVARYFDWFWELLPRSLFFIVAGAILLVGGMALEKTRRQVLTKMREME